MRELFKTNIGSHMWSMNTPDSDMDIFVAYIVPSEDILKGNAEANSKHIKNPETNEDIVYHEIGTIIEQFIKGNVNFLWGVMSPIVIPPKRENHLKLRDILSKNLSKNYYNSIHGLAQDNYNKYLYLKDKDIYNEKICNTIVRTLQFGITLLSEGVLKFEPVWNMNKEDVLYYIDCLDDTFEKSKLPEKPDENMFKNFLLDLRLKELRDEIDKII